MFQILDIGDTYECWGEAAKAKSLANMMKRALSHGKAKKKLIEITNKRTAWGEANMRENSHKCFRSSEKKSSELELTRNKWMRWKTGS